MSKLLISVGESSGDLQAGALLRQLKILRPDLQAFGIGGQDLAAAGQNNIYDVSVLSVMGGVEILGKLPRIAGIWRGINKLLRQERPNAVLLVDSAAFNFRVAKMARHLQIPVIYFIPPKIWAWNTGRVNFLRKNADLVISILPFEREFYQQHQVPFFYAGNPLVDLLEPLIEQNLAPQSGRIGLMPGSRRKEVEALLPVFGKMADILTAKHPELQFYCIQAPGFKEDYLRAQWASQVVLNFVPNADRYSFIPTCQALLAASGTATLETGLLGVPTIVGYRLNWLTWLLAKQLVKVNWVSLTNLIMQHQVFPELLQAECRPEQLAAQLEAWLADPRQVAQIKADLAQLRSICGEPGAAKRAAEQVAHFLPS